MIGKQIQEQALRTYLFSYAQYYDSIHIAQLASMFEIELPLAHSIVSNMMRSAELQASFDQPSGAIIVQCQDTSQLQNLALNFAEKANMLLDNNEQNEQRGTYDRSRWAEQSHQGHQGPGQGHYQGHQGQQGRPGQKPFYQRGGKSYHPNMQYGRSDRQFLRKKPGQRSNVGYSSYEKYRGVSHSSKAEELKSF